MKSNTGRILLVAVAAGALGLIAALALDGPGPLLKTEVGQRALQGVMSASAPPPPAGVTVAERGAPVPPMSLPGLDGKPVAVPAAYAGRPLLINVWASWCGPCIKEMPDLVKTYERHAPRGFELIAVAMAYDPPEYVANYTRKHGLPFKVVLDKDGSIAAAFGGVKLTPTAVVIDKRGRILSRFFGEPDFGSLRAVIERELAS